MHSVKPPCSLPLPLLTPLRSSRLAAKPQDPEEYRRDAATAEKVTEEAAKAGAKLSPEGDAAVNKLLKKVSEQMASGKGYNRFFAIGLFRCALGARSRGVALLFRELGKWFCLECGEAA